MLRADLPDRPVEGALEIAGVAAVGAVVQSLLARVLLEPDEALAGLTGVGAPSLVVLLGPADALPWVDGVVYLRRCAEAPGLLLPTCTRASVPPRVLLEAVLGRHPGLRVPIVVLPRHEMLASLDGACPLDRARLEQLRESTGA